MIKGKNLTIYPNTAICFVIVFHLHTMKEYLFYFLKVY